MFLDFVKIHVKAGQGGSGCVSFRREKFVPMGGPDGGDGGRGGSIVLVVNSQLRTLVDYSYKSQYKCRHGEHGKGSNRHGRQSDSITLQVPAGTLVRDADSGEILADLTEDGQKFVVAKGGEGGRGNARFVTSTNQAPRDWEVGEAGEERTVFLELKLIADVGLVGKPNAGKSTLLANITAARPKIAGYPFTTLQPNLGIVRYKEINSFVVADIPGLIEGAHSGKGLGHQFLRHIERNRLLLYLIDPLDPEEEDPLHTYHSLRNELEEHSPGLLDKTAAVVLTKKDVWGDDDWASRLQPKLAVPVLGISSVARIGLDELIAFVWKSLQETAANS